MVDKERKLARQIGEAIREKRKQRSWSQADLAEYLDISVDFVGMLERGVRLPAVPLLIKLAEVFGASLDDFVMAPLDDALREASALLRAVPPDAMPVVLAMLRGIVLETRPRPPVRRRLVHN